LMDWQPNEMGAKILRIKELTQSHIVTSVN
jgi:hypothetical protein